MTEAVKLMKHQREGLRAALKVRGPVFLNGETGTGKSKLAIAIAQALDAKRGLVVAPGAVLQAKWVEELREMGERAQALGKLKDYDATCDWHIVSYQSVCSQLKPLLYEIRPRLDCVIFDESHALKSRTAKRTRSWREYVAPNMLTGKLLLLSATPITKSPLDLVSQYEAVWLMDEKDRLYRNTNWKERWIGQRQIMECVGWRDKAAATALHARRMVRHTKEDVFKGGLPPMRHKLIDIPVPAAKLRALVAQKVCDGTEGFAAAMREAAVDDYFSGDRAEPTALGMRIINATLEAAGELKAKAAAEYIATCAETEQVVVFAHNRKVLRGVESELDALGVSSVLCSGEVRDASTLRRRAAGFIAGEAQVMLASYAVMGTGVDLVCSSHMVVVQQSFSPAVMQQAYNRIHRIGQTGMTRCDTLLAGGADGLHEIERNVARNHRRKNEAADGVGLTGSLATAVAR